jgi:hypothetical protein
VHHVGDLPEGARLGDDDGHGLLALGACLVDLLEHVLGGVLDLLEGAPVPHLLQVVDLAADGLAVFRQIIGEARDLAQERPA